MTVLENNRPNIPRMRTVKEAAAELKELDPNTALSEWRIRELALSGILPRVQAGKKLLINLDTLIEYLENPAAEKFNHIQSSAAHGGIKAIY